MTGSAAGASIATLVYTCGLSWQPFLDSASPAVVALLSATALWVASRTRGISRDVQSILLAIRASELERLESLRSSASPPTAPGPKRSSTRPITSTSPGDDVA